MKKILGHLVLIIVLTNGSNLFAQSNVWESVYSDSKNIFKSGDLSNALRTATMAYNLAKNESSLSTEKLADISFFVGKIYHSQTRYRRSEIFIKRAIDLLTNVDDAADQTNSAKKNLINYKIYLVEVYQEQGNFPAAIAFIPDLEQAIDNSAEDDNKAKLCSLISQCYKQNGMYAEAEPYLLQSINIYSSKNESEQVIVQLEEISQVYRMQEKFGEAVKSLERILEIYVQNNGSMSDETADVHVEIAKIYIAGNDFENAELHYQNAYRIKLDRYGYDNEKVRETLDEYNQFRVSAGKSIIKMDFSPKFMFNMHMGYFNCAIKRFESDHLERPAFGGSLSFKLRQGIFFTWVYNYYITDKVTKTPFTFDPFRRSVYHLTQNYGIRFTKSEFLPVRNSLSWIGIGYSRINLKRAETANSYAGRPGKTTNERELGEGTFIEFGGLFQAEVKGFRNKRKFIITHSLKYDMVTSPWDNIGGLTFMLGAGFMIK